MEVVVATPRGFCAGVVRAVRIVELALEKFGSPVYVKHQVVHNEHVVRRLEALGAITVDSVDEIPEGATAVFSAHGSPPAELEAAADRNLRLIDAVCPLVTRVHNEVKKYASEGRNVIIVGHHGHVETLGTLGYATRENVRVGIMQPESDARDFMAAALGSGPVAVVTQTTLSQDDVTPAIQSIQENFPDAIIRNDICYATTNRQDAVKRLAEEGVAVILVVGSPSSSNCNRLVEVAIKAGVFAHLVEGPEQLETWGPEWRNWHDAGWKEDYKIGVTSGASTPDDLLQAVVEKLNPDQVSYLDGPDEDFTFTLPRELRDESG